jgi:SAM-dependent methyltransferase
MSRQERERPSVAHAPNAEPIPQRRRRGVNRELEAASRAHYDDPTYYTLTYRHRIDDVQLYLSLATKGGGPVLEYGVGNGRIALPIARHGVCVTGVDHSRPMLDDLRERQRAEPADVQRRLTLRCGDMRSVRLKERFPLVIAPFNAVLHLYTREDVERFLTRAHEHLTDDGELVMDLSVPMLRDLLRDPTRPYRAPRFKHPTTGEIVRYTEHFDYDAASQVLYVSMEFAPNGETERAWMTPLAHRQFFPREWEALLHYNGFDVVKVSGDFHGGPFDRSSDVMVWHAQPRRSGKSRKERHR